MVVKKEFDISQHILVSKHSKLSDKEKREVFERYKINIKDMPKISKTDPAILCLDVKYGDIVRIERNSKTAGKTYFYRGVVDE